jgi:hypothetical protein
MSQFSLLEQWMLKGIIAVAGIAHVCLLARKDTIKNDKGNEKMQEVWLAIKTIAQGCPKQQLKQF